MLQEQTPSPHQEGTPGVLLSFLPALCWNFQQERVTVEHPPLNIQIQRELISFHRFQKAAGMTPLSPVNGVQPKHT